MTAFHFLRPSWFLVLPLLLGLLWLLWRRRLQSRSWQDVCDPELLPHLLLGRSRRRAHWPLWLLLAGLIVTVTALAGPAWQKQPQPLFRQQSALVILFDLSRSMTAGDLKPSRLVRARLKIKDILRQRREGQTALIVFAGDAFVVTPLTDDQNTIESLLSSLDAEMMPVQGSEPGRALEMGAELLQRAGLPTGTLLLVTDEDRPQRVEDVARKLRQQGLRLAILGVGTPEGAPIPLPDGGFFKDRDGNLVLPRLEETGLRQLARVAGGDYRRLSVDDSDFHSLLSELESRRLDRSEQSTTRLGDHWQEAGVWLLWPLALLAAVGFRRGWLAVLALLLMVPQPAAALNWQDLWQRPDQQAHSAFQAGDYKTAGDNFEDPRWKASALYRAGQYAEALKSHPQAESANDWYNRGTALARTGQLDEALAAYDQALQLNPGDEDTRTNRKLVEEALKQQQQNSAQGEGEPPQTDENKQSEAQAQAQAGQSDQTDLSDQSNTSGQCDQEPTAGQPQASDQMPDSTEQSAEDGQNSQGQERANQADSDQAQQPGDKQQPESGRQAGGEQDRQQESQLSATAADQPPANAEQRELQQWLQRIPDDPGGLLRRKFLYQYRQRGRQLETDRPW